MSIRSQEKGTLAQPLRDEHKELLMRFESLRTVADSVGDVSSEEVRRGVDEVYELESLTRCAEGRSFLRSRVRGHGVRRDYR